MVRVCVGRSLLEVRFVTMGRAPCCDEKVALKKGPWTPDEDQKLVVYIQHNGHGSWRSLPEKAGTVDNARVHILGVSVEHTVRFSK